VRTRSVRGDDRDEQLDLAAALEPAVFANGEPAATCRGEPRQRARLQRQSRVTGERSGRGSDCEDHRFDASFNRARTLGRHASVARQRVRRIGREPDRRPQKAADQAELFYRRVLRTLPT
jgi:hypothetical protein